MLLLRKSFLSKKAYVAYSISIRSLKQKIPPQILRTYKKDCENHRVHIEATNQQALDIIIGIDVSSSARKSQKKSPTNLAGERIELRHAKGTTI